MMLVKAASLTAVVISFLHWMQVSFLLLTSSVRQPPHNLWLQGWIATGIDIISQQNGHVICYLTEFAKFSEEAALSFFFFSYSSFFAFSYSYFFFRSASSFFLCSFSAAFFLCSYSKANLLAFSNSQFFFFSAQYFFLYSYSSVFLLFFCQSYLFFLSASFLFLCSYYSVFLLIQYYSLFDLSKSQLFFATITSFLNCFYHLFLEYIFSHEGVQNIIPHNMQLNPSPSFQQM